MKFESVGLWGRFEENDRERQQLRERHRREVEQRAKREEQAVTAEIEQRYASAPTGDLEALAVGTGSLSREVRQLLSMHDFKPTKEEVEHFARELAAKELALRGVEGWE